MRHTLWSVVPILGTTMLLLVTGCSSGTPGQAQPSSTGGASTTTTTQGGSSSSGGPSQAPKVASPLNATRFVNDSCAALTSADLAGLQLVNPINGGSHRNAGGVQCTWTGSPGGSVGVGWETANVDGLSDLYAQASTIAYWQPITVDGYPAAFGDPINDGRAQGDCVLHVGVTDHLYFDSSFNNPSNAGQSCDLARQAASDVIRNLGGSRW